MNFKRILTLLLTFALVFSLAGCGQPEGADNKEQKGNEDQQGQEDRQGQDEQKEPEKSGLKIAVVTSPSGVDDGSFNQDVYEGVMKYVDENPDAICTHVWETNMDNAVQAVEDIVADYDVIVTPGFQFGSVGAIARDNPDKKFILVDEFAKDEEGNQIDDLTNMYAMLFAEQESGFLAGIAAALETKTGKVAVVNGMPFPSNVNYQYGFEAGVNYANKAHGKNTEIVELDPYKGTDVITGSDIGGNYVGDFNDPVTAREIGDELIRQGCDIIFVAAGNSGNGIFAAAKESDNVMVIGCDVDQWADGETTGRNIILTSGLKNMAINVYRQLNDIRDGKFKGGNYTLTAETDSTGAVTKEGHHQMSAETVKALDDAYQLVKTGKIVPPGEFTGTFPEDFPGL